MKRRSRLEITLSVLRIINDGEEKATRIMYAANLSWRPTKDVLANLVEQNLIDVTIDADKSRRSRQAYYITDKGKEVLEHFADVTTLLGDVL